MATKFKVKEVEDAARLILLDTYDNAFRFEPKEIYAAMWDGLLRIRRERPQSRYVGGLLADLKIVGETATWTSIPAITDSGDNTRENFRDGDVEMEERWKEAVVYYVVFRMYQKDDPDTKNDALSARYFEMYNAALGG